MAQVYLSLGCNLGTRDYYITESEKIIENNIGNIVKSSSLYETEPWGTSHPNWFFNKVIIAESKIDPFQILEKIHTIEKSLGRTKSTKKYSPRTIDIDILFIDRLIINDNNLIIPHPRIQERKFVLVPLAEIDGGFVHPLSNRTIIQLLKECSDNHLVRTIN